MSDPGASTQAAILPEKLEARWNCAIQDVFHAVLSNPVKSDRTGQLIR
jgi:hypothetical protein